MTAEFAVALPAVLLLFALLLGGAAAGATQLRLEEAALAAARALARGESQAAAEAIAKRLAGASATAAIAADGEWISVTVADRVAGPLGSVVPWTLSARASARNETAGALGSAAPGRTTWDLITPGPPARELITPGPPARDLITPGPPPRDLITTKLPPQDPNRPRPLWQVQRPLAAVA